MFFAARGIDDFLVTAETTYSFRVWNIKMENTLQETGNDGVCKVSGVVGVRFDRRYAGTLILKIENLEDQKFSFATEGGAISVPFIGSAVFSNSARVELQLMGGSYGQFKVEMYQAEISIY